MNILLIQPPDAPPAVGPHDAAYGHSDRFVPSWNLQCLRAFILNRTRCGCEFIDTRFFEDPEQPLALKIHGMKNLKLAVIETSSLGIGPVATVIELVRRIAPGLKIAICGQHPSQFPEKSDALPGADFALCGDPEPILRNLMDGLDVESRLQRVPGLRIAGQPPVPPYWLPDLKSLSMPDWSGANWGGYTVPPPRQGSLAELRLSRGHTRAPADRSHGSSLEPLRTWPFDRAAAALQKCPSAGIVEVFFNDAPGFWTDARLFEWCAELDRARSTQPWSFQMLPRSLSPELVNELQFVCCRRVEVIFPSSSADVLARYECALDLKSLSRTFSALQRAGIDVEARFWIGGPEEGKGETDRVLRILRRLGFPPYSLHSFPLAFDAPVYAETDAPGKPSIEAWIKWARDPWMAEKPTALWGDEKARAYINTAMQKIKKSIRNDPRHRLLGLIDKVRTTRIIEWIEDFSVGLLRGTLHPK